MTAPNGSERWQNVSGQDRRRILERLYRAHHRRLVGRLARRLPDPGDAEEVAQEAYLRCLAREAPGGGSEVRSWLSYLFRVARNLAIDRMRREAMTRDKLDLLAGDSARSQEERRRPGVHRPAPLSLVEPASERMIDARGELVALAAAINDLDPRIRQAFIWHRFHGLAYAEIARRLGVSVSSVEKYIMTALLACRQARARARIARHDGADEAIGALLGGQVGVPVAAGVVEPPAVVDHGRDVRKTRARSSEERDRKTNPVRHGARRR